MGLDPLMKLSEMRDITGEINIARYVNRLIETRSPQILRYETNGAAYANKIDSALEKIHAILHGAAKQKLAALRGSYESHFLDELSLVDIVLGADRPSLNDR